MHFSIFPDCICFQFVLTIIAFLFRILFAYLYRILVVGLLRQMFKLSVIHNPDHRAAPPLPSTAYLVIS